MTVPVVFPPAPWRLCGEAVLTVRLLEVERARPFVPAELEIVSVWPGKTLAGLCLARYGPGSTLEYNELIVFPALVRYGNHVGGWVSHIYVDNESSVAGGREIWGLPKELAQFANEAGKTVVRNEQGLLCSMRLERERRLWRQGGTISAFGMRGGHPLFFKATGKARLNGAAARWEIPTGSPFAALNLQRGGWTVRLSETELDVYPPFKDA